MRKLYLFISFFLFACALMAQKNLSADKLFQQGDYALALEKYAKILETYPTSSLYLYKYARCADELGDDATALQYYLQVSDRYVDRHFYMAEIYLQRWNAEAALEAYTTYLSLLEAPADNEAYVQQQMLWAQKLQRYLRRVERMTVIDSVLVPIEHILRQCVLSAEVGRLQSDSLNGMEFINQRGDYKIWSELVDSTHYLYSSHRLLDDWTTPEQLPLTVNFTPAQYAPYVLADGVTLYFAAQDTNGLGGLDIYVTRYNSVKEEYTEPDNIGMPYNSPANEYMLLLDEVQEVGYLATDRFAPEGYAHVYSFILPRTKQYWRGLATDSVVAYAQLRSYLHADDSYSRLYLPTITVHSDDAIHFVLNDSIVYTSAEQFLSPEAYVMFMEWENQQIRARQEQQELEMLRLEYMEADEALRQELAPRILQLESNQSLLQQYSQSLLNQIRQIELSAQ